jgi:hypothetical protein
LNTLQEWLDSFAARQASSENELDTTLEPLPDDTDPEEEVFIHIFTLDYMYFLDSSSFRYLYANHIRII